MGQHLTKRDVEKIEKEIEMRRVELRPKLTKAVAEAAAQGDRSENFEYYAAKRENNQNNSRIRYLERVLRTAEIVEDTAEDEVGVDKEVRVYLPDDDEEDTYTLVTPIRADAPGTPCGRHGDGAGKRQVHLPAENSGDPGLLQGRRARHQRILTEKKRQGLFFFCPQTGHMKFSHSGPFPVARDGYTGGHTEKSL